MNTPHTKQSGYTLLETLVAIVILTLCIVAPLSIASRALFSSSVARGEVTAFYLAQEAIEGVRNVRDQNGLASASWLSGFPALGSDFTIDVVNVGGNGKPTMNVCNGSCPNLQYDSTTHLYEYGSGTDSGFNRTVRISAISGTSDEVAVSVTVVWNVGSVSRSFVARENLTNWQ